jgi:hypothetical protein
VYHGRFRLLNRGLRFNVHDNFARLGLLQPFNPFPTQHLFFQMPNRAFSRSMLPHKAGFIFAHLLADFGNDLINRDIHVIAYRCRLQRYVIATVQNHLCSVTVLLNIQDYLYFDNLWIIKVKASQPASAVLFHRIRDADVPPSHLDWWICILYLHIWALSSLG